MVSDGLFWASLVAKALWVVSSLIAIGLALQIACGVVASGVRPTHRLLKGATIVMLLAICVRFGVSTLELAGGLDGALGLVPIVYDMQKASLAAALAGGILLFGGMVWRIRPMIFIGAIVAASAFGLTGHARSHDQPVWAASLVAMHVALAAFWASAPLTLWPKASLSSQELADRNRRFGQIALVAVPSLMAAGLYLGWSFAGGLAGLIDSSYGVMIGLKALCALTAVAVGAWNRLRIAAELNQDALRARFHLTIAMTIDSFVFAGACLAVIMATTVAVPEF